MAGQLSFWLGWSCIRHPPPCILQALLRLGQGFEVALGGGGYCCCPCGCRTGFLNSAGCLGGFRLTFHGDDPLTHTPLCTQLGVLVAYLVLHSANLVIILQWYCILQLGHTCCLPSRCFYYSTLVILAFIISVQHRSGKYLQ